MVTIKISVNNLTNYILFIGYYNAHVHAYIYTYTIIYINYTLAGLYC